MWRYMAMKYYTYRYRYIFNEQKEGYERPWIYSKAQWHFKVSARRAALCHKFNVQNHPNNWQYQILKIEETIEEDI